jgi:hypothetical protein
MIPNILKAEMKILNKISGFYSNAYKGEIKAWKVFVFGYLAPLVPYAILFGILTDLRLPNGFYWLTVARFFYNIWLILSLWRCSPNVDKPFFNFLTKSFALLIALDSIASVAILIR